MTRMIENKCVTDTLINIKLITYSMLCSMTLKTCLASCSRLQRTEAGLWTHWEKIHGGLCWWQCFLRCSVRSSYLWTNRSLLSSSTAKSTNSRLDLPRQVCICLWESDNCKWHTKLHLTHFSFPWNLIWYFCVAPLASCFCSLCTCYFTLTNLFISHTCLWTQTQYSLVLSCSSHYSQCHRVYTVY